MLGAVQTLNKGSSCPEVLNSFSSVDSSLGTVCLHGSAEGSAEAPSPVPAAPPGQLLSPVCWQLFVEVQFSFIVTAIRQLLIT